MPHNGLPARKRRLGEKSHNMKMDELRVERGDRPRRLVKTRKRIAHARHTHVARFRLRKGPAPRIPYEWDDPEQMTRDAMIQFIDPYELDPELLPPGRKWHAAEIRLKSNEDLQKLWVVLMKERNMLYTSALQHQKQKTRMPHPYRTRAVRKSMAMIKVVLHERQVEKRARDTQIKTTYALALGVEVMAGRMRRSSTRACAMRAAGTAKRRPSMQSTSTRVRCGRRGCLMLKGRCRSRPPLLLPSYCVQRTAPRRPCARSRRTWSSSFRSMGSPSTSAALTCTWCGASRPSRAQTRCVTLHGCPSCVTLHAGPSYLTSPVDLALPNLATPPSTYFR